MSTPRTNMALVNNSPSLTHELQHFAQCSLFNSGYAYAEGFDKAVCSCGWVSAPSRNHTALVALWKVHKDTV
jgi:hypothetical protein